jgi:putative sterol carrier protein
MPQYASEQELYEGLGAVLSAAATDAVLSLQLKGADAVVQHRLRDPQATVTLDARASKQPRVDLGETKLEPDVVLSMSGDTAHELWNGRLNVTLALAGGDIAAKGPVGKLLKHVALVEPLSKRYEELLSGAAVPEVAQEAPAEPVVEAVEDVPAEPVDVAEEPVAQAAASEPVDS